MGEPIQLHAKDGRTLDVYTRNQAEALIAAGEWYATAADAKAGHVRAELTPATDARLAALEAGAGIVTEDVTESPAPDLPPGFEDVEPVEAIITVKKEPAAPKSPAPRKATKGKAPR